MDTDFQKKKDEIVKKIQEKLFDFKCPLCQKSSFTIPEGYFAHDLQDNLISRHMGGKNVPVVPVVCENCGFLMEFAVGVLGFLPNKQNNPK